MVNNHPLEFPMPIVRFPTVKNSFRSHITTRISSAKVFVVVFRIRDDKNSPANQSSRLTKWGHFISEEGALRASLVMYFTMLLDLGESVSKRVMCGYSGAHTHENSSFELGLLFA